MHSCLFISFQLLAAGTGIPLGCPPPAVRPLRSWFRPSSGLASTPSPSRSCILRFLLERGRYWSAADARRVTTVEAKGEVVVEEGARLPMGVLGQTLSADDRGEEEYTDEKLGEAEETGGVAADREYRRCEEV